jgi:cytochrome c peroxidase
MINNSNSILAFAVILLLFSCKKEKITALQDEIKLEVPSYFPQPNYNFQGNPLSTKKFELGRKLFYDTYLSIDNTISCASCHHQQYAFSDAGNALSAGVNGTLGSRNSPAMFNLIWNTSFMWDGGINHIEIMPLAPITDHREMNISMPDLIAKLNSSSSYKALFKDAFEVETITDYELFLALAQFMGMLISADSKYDKYIQGKATLTASELAGLELFRNHCASCHIEPLFSDMDFHNNGLDEEFEDEGRYLITLLASDKGKFRTPSLRNIEVTGPYMHDGRFHTLEQVLDHYSDGIQQSSTLAPGLVSGILLSSQDKTDLIAFLKTLTDYGFLSNPKFSPVD